MDLRRYELATIAARAPAAVELLHARPRLRADRELHGAGRPRGPGRGLPYRRLEPIDLAVMKLADKVARDATSVDRDRRRAAPCAGAHGRRDRRRRARGGGAGLLQQDARRRSASSPTRSTRARTALRDALTVGRPIAAGARVGRAPVVTYRSLTAAAPGDAIAESSQVDKNPRDGGSSSARALRGRPGPGGDV